MRRRELILAGLAGLGEAMLIPPRDPALRKRLAAIERKAGGRLGVAIHEMASRRQIVYQADERFPMASTFKWLLAAQVLARVDAGKEQLSRIITYGKADLLEYAPVTKEHLKDGGMTVSALAEAAVTYSDNTAANLLLATVGGPAGLTAFCRSIGDRVTRLDRTEPELNTATPGDRRDTTSPAAMVANLRALLFGPRLSVGSREILIGWLVGNTTGAARIRAGLPAGWKVGDKTGTGEHGSTNDVAIVWPPGRGPVLVAAYLTESGASAADRNAALADVGRLMAEWAAPMPATAPKSGARKKRR